ncbi:hypothetical protein [Flexibacterium corallicola]|uniref:hypothetical protein n=1 Tax=Flexibacterium corallicola TaxID=3037259 RepID=UPI00286EEF99|nr:hypothetical protein [Pseudovibrio sp. M1P-2-3]
MSGLLNLLRVGDDMRSLIPIRNRGDRPDGRGRSIWRINKKLFHGSYQYLDWRENVITYTDINPSLKNTISGEFTGCWFCEFTTGGQRCIAHLGTSSDDIPGALLVKAAWNQQVNNNNFQNVRGINPSRYLLEHHRGSYKSNPRVYCGFGQNQVHFILVGRNSHIIEKIIKKKFTNITSNTYYKTQGIIYHR